MSKVESIIIIISLPKFYYLISYDLSFYERIKMCLCGKIFVSFNDILRIFSDSFFHCLKYFLCLCVCEKLGYLLHEIKM